MTHFPHANPQSQEISGQGRAPSICYYLKDPMTRHRHLTGLDLTEIHLAVANNGYVISTDDEPPEDVHVFQSFELMVAWLFVNLTKPKEAPSSH